MNDVRFRDVVKTANGKHVLIDSCLTMDHGFETMVFPCTPGGEVIVWCELDVEWYKDVDEMAKGHEQLVARWHGRNL